MVILRMAAPFQPGTFAFKLFQSFKPFNPLLHPPPRLREERVPALSLSKMGARGNRLTPGHMPPRVYRRSESLP